MWTELKQHCSPILGPPRLSPIKKTISWEKHLSTPDISKNVLCACSDVTFLVYAKSDTQYQCKTNEASVSQGNLMLDPNVAYWGLSGIKIPI